MGSGMVGSKIADCDRTISRLRKIFHNLQIGVQFQNAQRNLTNS